MSTAKVNGKDCWVIGRSVSPHNGETLYDTRVIGSTDVKDIRTNITAAELEDVVPPPKELVDSIIVLSQLKPEPTFAERSLALAGQEAEAPEEQEAA